jgi:hypothetical protein
MESVVDIVGKFINSNISPNISGVNENNEINVIKVPEELIGNYHYLDLFKALISQKKQIIPLAIVREAQENMNELPYVLTNPPPMATFAKGDLILMMGTSEDLLEIQFTHK